MTETLASATSLLRGAAETLAGASARLVMVDPGSHAFGAGGPGRLGDVGRELYLHWQRALDARAHEAAVHGARLDEAADAVARAAGGYADVDDVAGRGHPEVG
jgi:hypothetical protein